MRIRNTVFGFNIKSKKVEIYKNTEREELLWNTVRTISHMEVT